MLDKILTKVVGILLGILIAKKTKELLHNLQPGGNYTMKCTWGIKKAFFEINIHENIKLEEFTTAPEGHFPRAVCKDVKTVPVAAFKFGVDENNGTTEMDTEEFNTVHTTLLEDVKNFRQTIATPAMAILDKIIDGVEKIGNKFVDHKIAVDQSGAETAISNLSQQVDALNEELERTKALVKK